MRIRLTVAAVVMVCLGLFAVTRLSAQRPAVAAPRGGVALVDVAGVSQNCTRLKQSLETLKTEYEAKIGRAHV
jgi:hypothetical protein